MTNSEFKAADVSRARRPVPWLRWVLYAAVTAIILYFLWICSKNPNFEWGVVAQYFTHDSILHGIKMTLGLTVVSMVIGTVLGLICALGKLSGSRFFQYAQQHLSVVLPLNPAAGAAAFLVQPRGVVSRGNAARDGRGINQHAHHAALRRDHRALA